jgi:hypothetical protein
VRLNRIRYNFDSFNSLHDFISTKFLLNFLPKPKSDADVLHRLYHLSRDPKHINHVHIQRNPDNNIEGEGDG